MGYQKLLIWMVGLLIVATGGVFVLVHQEEGVGEMSQEALVAGVEQVAEPEPRKEKVFEAKPQTEESFFHQHPLPVLCQCPV